MGILNLSRDSFAGPTPDPIRTGHAMIAAGAAILDIGGESTRPGASPVDPAEERARILPTLRALRDAGATLSVDTRNASTMAAAIDAGATLVNDVSGLSHDPDAAALVAQAGCGVVLMHMRGTPQTMASLTQYTDVVAEVTAALAERVAVARAAGIPRTAILIDPGIGFAKTGAQNLALLRGLPALRALGLPILVGASRKRFLAELGGGDRPEDRDAATIAAGLYAVSAGADVLRVHDVAGMARALRVWCAL